MKKEKTSVGELVGKPELPRIADEHRNAASLQKQLDSS